MHTKHLATISTLKLGGNSFEFYEPSSLTLLIDLCLDFTSHSRDFVVIGRLSNSLFRSGPISTPIISTRRLTRFDITDCELSCEPGVYLPSLARHLSNLGYPQFNPLSGIPGTIGGSVVNNAGSYGTCMSDLLHSVDLLDSSGKISRYSCSDLNYSWRSSRLKLLHSGFVLLTSYFSIDFSSLDIQYSNEQKPLLFYLNMRSTEQCCSSPNLGSTFATEDILVDTLSNKPLLYSITLGLRKLFLLLHFQKAVIARLNKYLFIFLHSLPFKYLNRLSSHNPNVFLKLNDRDSPEAFFADVSFISRKFPSIPPIELNLYMDIK